MLKVLHVHASGESGIAAYVSLLADAQKSDIEVKRACGVSELKASCNEWLPDILHLHGCWNSSLNNAARRLCRQGVRLVVTPHNQLQPWVIEALAPQAKMGRKHLLQRRTTSEAYALVAQGPLEAGSLKELGWNPRIETIANPLVTKSVTMPQVAQQHLLVYQRVMNSYVAELFSEDTLQTLRTLLKAGITDDARWMQDLTVAEQTEWSLLMHYAILEGIDDVVRRGMKVLGIDPSGLPAKSLPCYVPDHYQQPQPLSAGNVADLFKTCIQHPTLRSLVDLDMALRRPYVDEDLLMKQLDEAGLAAAAARIVQLLAEQTALDEGFMPTPPINDKRTDSLRTAVMQHLKL